MQIAIIGAGPAGIFAAIQTAELNPDARITVCESTNYPLAKVALSGGGRCNLTNATTDPKQLIANYPRGSRELLGPFHTFGPRQTVEWFQSHDVPLKTEPDGRIFPASDTSADIVNCLLDTARSHAVSLLLNHPIDNITKADDGTFTLHSDTRAPLRADKLLIATGGSRSPDSPGYKFAQSLGHSITPPVPSLFALNTSHPLLANLEGLPLPNTTLSLTTTNIGTPANKGRAVSPKPPFEAKQQPPTGTSTNTPGAAAPYSLGASRYSLVDGGTAATSDTLLITHTGISGPATLKFSSLAARTLAALDYHFPLTLNLTGTSSDKAQQQLSATRAQHPKKQLSTLNPFNLPSRLWLRLLDLQKLPHTTHWANTSNQQLQSLALALTATVLPITGKSTHKEEFVTSGGVRLDEINFKTMQSRLTPNLYFAGEILDIDALTGGFNLQSCWTTAHLAAQSLANPI